jgi:hypothetical protein
MKTVVNLCCLWSADSVAGASRFAPPVKFRPKASTTMRKPVDLAKERVVLCWCPAKD